MDDLLLIVDEELTINPHFLTIEVIRSIWKRDVGQSMPNKATGKNERVKTIARKELSYIWFMENWRSIYQSYKTEDKKIEKIKEALNLSETWKEDKVVKEAREWYAAYQIETNELLQNLKSAKKARAAIQEFLDSVNLMGVANLMPNGAAKWKPKDVSAAIKDLESTDKSIKALEDTVRKAQTVSKTIRGGGTAGMYEN